MTKKEAKVLVLWLIALVILLGLLIAFPLFIGYASQGDPENIVNLTSCQDITTSDTTYYLQNDVSASGTCFNIKADKIVIDGQGHTLNYSISVLGFGINNSEGHDNVKVRNLKIEQNGTRGSWIGKAYAIYSENSDGFEITGNSIRLNSDGGNIGTYLVNSVNSTISNNFIHVMGLNGLNHGIFISGGVVNSVLNNNITVNSTASNGLGNIGINISNSRDNILTNNIIYSDSVGTAGTRNYGIFVDKSNNTELTFNSVNSKGPQYTTSVNLGGSSFNNILAYNTISSNSVNYPIALGVINSFNNNISSNNIYSTSSTDTRGIYSSLSDLNYYYSNNLYINSNSNADTSGAGITIFDSNSFNTFNSNNIIINDIGSIGSSQGILFNGRSGSNQNSFTDNNISITGPRSSGLAFAQRGASIIYNNFTNNNFLTAINYDLKDEKISYINNTYFIDQKIRNYIFNNSGSIINFKNIQNGEIIFLQPINGSGNNLSNEIKISNNFILINELNDGLNKASRTTFYNIPTSIANASILRNGAVCNATTIAPCYNLTSFDAGNVIFNLTKGGNYTINYTLLVQVPRNVSAALNNTNFSLRGITYEISEEEVNRGISSTVESEDRIIIKSGNQRYEIRFRFINDTTLYLDVTNNTERIMFVGDKTGFDVNNDNIFDYEITLLSIEDNKSSLFIKKVIIGEYEEAEGGLSLGSGAGEGEGTGQSEKVISLNKGKILYYLAIILLSLGIIVVIFLIIRVYYKSKDEERKESSLSSPIYGSQFQVK